MWRWVTRDSRRRRERSESLRQERGKLAAAVIELGRKRVRAESRIEDLMKRMIEELKKDA